MKKPNSNDTAGMLMALTQGVATWHAVVPDLKEINSKTVDDTEFYREFRRSELTAGSITFGVGVLGSMLMQEWYPLLASILIIALLVIIFETAMRSAPPVQ